MRGCSRILHSTIKGCSKEQICLSADKSAEYGVVQRKQKRVVLIGCGSKLGCCYFNSLLTWSYEICMLSTKILYCSRWLQVKEKAWLTKSIYLGQLVRELCEVGSSDEVKGYFVRWTLPWAHLIRHLIKMTKWVIDFLIYQFRCTPSPRWHLVQPVVKQPKQKTCGGVPGFSTAFNKWWVYRTNLDCTTHFRQTYSCCVLDSNMFLRFVCLMEFTGKWSGWILAIQRASSESRSFSLNIKYSKQCCAKYCNQVVSHSYSHCWLFQ